MSTDKKDGTVDVLVILALKDELDALKSIEEGRNGLWTNQVDDQGLTYYLADFGRDKGGIIRLAAARAVDQGGQYAITRAASLVDKLDPLCLAMCGICAGRKGKVSLGDVIVASKTFKYDAGKQKRGEFQPDMDTYSLNQVWKQACEDFPLELVQRIGRDRPPTLEAQSRWFLHTCFKKESPQNHRDCKTRCPDYADVARKLIDHGLIEPESPLRLTQEGCRRVKGNHLTHPNSVPEDPDFRLHVGSIATGEKVVEDERIFKRLIHQNRNTLGLDREASSIPLFAESRNINHWIVAKGVQDYAFEKDDSMRQFACLASARFLLCFLRRNLRSRPTSTRPQTSKPHEVAGNEPRPPADTDFNKEFSAEEMSVYLNGDVEYPMIPVDLGTVWGFDRGLFIGLLAGGSWKRATQALIQAENILENALRQSPSLPFEDEVPSRRWVTIDVSAAAIPSSGDDLLDTIQENQPTLACWLRDRPPPPAFTLGVVLYSSSSSTNAQKLEHWCTALLRRRFEWPVSGILVDIPEPVSAGNLKMRLGGALEDVTVEIARFAATTPAGAPRGSRDLLLRSALAAPPAGPAGRHLLAWVENSMADPGRRELIEKHSKHLRTVLQELLDSGISPVGDSPASGLVDDFEAIQRNANFEKLAEEALRIVITDDISRTERLANALGASRSALLRRLAVRAFVRDRIWIDRFIDAWLAGHQRQDIAETFSRFGEWAAEGGVSLAEALALGLLRKAIHPELPDTLQELCSKTFQKLYAARQANDAERTALLEEATAQEIALALRMKLKIPHDFLPKKLDLYSAAPWWLWSCRSPAELPVTALLQRDVLSRGVAGLLSPPEREAVLRHSGDAETIRLCRRNRPIFGRVLVV